MSEVFSGEFSCALDEKGRIMLPTKLRAGLSGSRVVITRGIDECLSIFPFSLWEKFLAQFFATFSPLEKRVRLLQRRIVAPAQECEVSKNGRVLIPKALINVIGLQRECAVLGMHSYIEVWNVATYQEYLKVHDQEFVDAAEELGQQLGGLLNGS